MLPSETYWASRIDRSRLAENFTQMSILDCFWMYPITGLNSKYFLVAWGWLTLNDIGISPEFSNTSFSR